jgi:hypothetical protein
MLFGYDEAVVTEHIKSSNKIKYSGASTGSGGV